ncbi:MAG: nuclear transport factor 2 family protein [Thermoplasmata archaeon]
MKGLGPDAKRLLGYCTRSCRHHNPYFPAGMPALTDAMVEVTRTFARSHRATFANPPFRVLHTIEEGDLVAVHAHLRPSPSGGTVQVHMFRIHGDKIAEYRDVSQVLPARSRNLHGVLKRGRPRRDRGRAPV